MSPELEEEADEVVSVAKSVKSDADSIVMAAQDVDHDAKGIIAEAKGGLDENEPETPAKSGLSKKSQEIKDDIASHEKDLSEAAINSELKEKTRQVLDTVENEIALSEATHSQVAFKLEEFDFEEPKADSEVSEPKTEELESPKADAAKEIEPREIESESLEVIEPESSKETEPEIDPRSSNESDKSPKEIEPEIETEVKPEVDPKSSKELGPESSKEIEPRISQEAKSEEIKSRIKSEIKEPETKSKTEPESSSKDDQKDEPKRASISELAQRFSSAAATKAPPERPARRPMPRSDSTESTKIDKSVFEKETPKVPTKPKPQVSGRIGQLKSSIFADLNAALSKGPPGRRPSKPTSESENDEAPELAPSLPEEDADSQLKAIASNPRARPRGPKRRLPEAAKAKWSTATSHLWSIEHDTSAGNLKSAEGGEEAEGLAEANEDVTSETQEALKEAEDFSDPVKKPEPVKSDSPSPKADSETCDIAFEEAENYSDPVPNVDPETTDALKEAEKFSDPVGKPEPTTSSKGESETCDIAFEEAEDYSDPIQANVDPETTDALKDAENFSDPVGKPKPIAKSPKSESCDVDFEAAEDFSDPVKPKADTETHDALTKPEPVQTGSASPGAGSEPCDIDFEAAEDYSDPIKFSKSDSKSDALRDAEALVKTSESAGKSPTAETCDIDFEAAENYSDPIKPSQSSELQTDDTRDTKTPPARPSSRPRRGGVDELDARSEDLQKRLTAAKEKIRQARERKASAEPNE